MTEDDFRKALIFILLAFLQMLAGFAGLILAIYMHKQEDAKFAVDQIANEASQTENRLVLMIGNGKPE